MAFSASGDKPLRASRITSATFRGSAPFSIHILLARERRIGE
jgi:hypothetical protein